MLNLLNMLNMHLNSNGEEKSITSTCWVSFSVSSSTLSLSSSYFFSPTSFCITDTLATATMFGSTICYRQKSRILRLQASRTQCATHFQESPHATTSDTELEEPRKT